MHFFPQAPAEIVKEIDEIGDSSPGLESGMVSEFHFSFDSSVPNHLLVIGWAELMVDGQGSGNTGWPQITNEYQNGSTVYFRKAQGVILITSVPVLTILSLYFPSQWCKLSSNRF